MSDPNLPPHYDTITSAATATNALPTLDSLPAPSELLLRPPYHLFVELDLLTKKQITIQCSHQPSLHLLTSYLEKHCRTALTADKSVCTLNLKYERSSYIPRQPVYDRVTVSAAARSPVLNTVTLAPILALIEGLLGYERVSSEVLKDGHSFHFRRNRPFDNV